MKKILVCSDVCPYCGLGGIGYDYEDTVHEIKGGRITFVGDSVFAFCYACGYESDRFSQRELGPVQAHVYACNFLSSNDDFSRYELGYHIRK